MTAGLTVGLAGCGGGDGTPADDSGTDTQSPSPSGGDTQSGTTRPPGTPSPDDTPTASPTPGDTPTGGPTPTGTPTPTATPTATPRDAAQVVEVSPDGSFAFEPESFEVTTGETVVWVWRGGGHNVRVDSKPDGSDWSGTPGGDGDTYSSGDTHSHTFTTPGDYEYYCGPHRSCCDMEGTFTVTE